MTDFLTRLCLVGAAVLFAAWLVLKNRGRIARAADAIVKVSRARLAAFLAFVVVAAIYGGAKNGTNAPPQGASPPMLMMGGGIAQSVSAEDAVRGYMLESETTNETYLYAMPTNGMRRENWWLRGAYEDVFRLDLDGLLFPLGTNLCGSLWVYTWGMAGARLGDASNRIVATGVPMSAVPQVSRFWDAPTTNGSRLLTWENFFLNRDTNTPVSAQLELMPSGDFIARSNLVERLYRRVNPDDWDDDGIPNDDDIQPLVYDGDNFGPHQTLPEGANSNAYCWVDVVVPDANAIVTFTGDGYSALPDPTYVARAGDTNRVILLIGKTYHVTSRMPIVCIGQSSGEIEVDWVSATELTICWPVEIECVGMRSGALFAMSVWPDCLGGGFTWTNSCCQVASIGGWQYSISCGNNCLCTGCGAEGYYGYEAYRLPAGGGSCGCLPHGDDGGGDEEPSSVGVTVSFSKDAVIFENAYTNSYGQHVNGQSTMTRLTCIANGGVHGGHLAFSVSGVDKLLCVTGYQPPSGGLDLAPNEIVAFNIDYLGKESSVCKGDINAVATLTESVTGIVHEDMALLTSIGVRTCVHSSWIPWTARKELGVGEKSIVIVEPCGDNLGLSVIGCEYSQEQWIYRAPFHGAVDGVSIACGGATLPIVFTVVEPESVVAASCVTNSTVDVGIAGGIVCEYDLHLLPTNVSFSALETSELSRVSTNACGYFAKPELAELLDHGAHGGGVWHSLMPRNLFFDTASISAIPGDWLGGGAFTYPIPRAWRPIGVASITNELNHSPSYDQRMELDSDGTTRIIKFNYTVERSTNGIMTVTRSGQ